jgi:hypothetical protein
MATLDLVTASLYLPLFRRFVLPYEKHLQRGSLPDESENF